MCLLVVVLALSGWFRGIVAQLAAIAGLLGGVWAGALVNQWVGAQWVSAQPTAVFWALRWLVSVLAALTVISLINALGDRLSRAIQELPGGWLDRAFGIAAGAATGIVLASLMVMLAVRAPMGHFVERSIAQARAPRPLLTGGAEACRRGVRFPGARGLRREYVIALRRLERESPSI